MSHLLCDNSRKWVQVRLKSRCCVRCPLFHVTKELRGTCPEGKGADEMNWNSELIQFPPDNSAQVTPPRQQSSFGESPGRGSISFPPCQAPKEPPVLPSALHPALKSQLAAWKSHSPPSSQLVEISGLKPDDWFNASQSGQAHPAGG